MGHLLGGWIQLCQYLPGVILLPVPIIERGGVTKITYKRMLLHMVVSRICTKIEYSLYIYNAGFRYINAQANVTTYTNIGSRNTYAQIGVGVRVCWIWKDGTVHLQTLSRDMRDHQNPANNEVEVVWTREADAGTFTNNVFVKKLIYGNYNSSTKYWAIGTIVSVYVTDTSGTASAMCKLNSFNSWFSKS